MKPILPNARAQHHLAEHGEFVIARCGQLLMFSARGPWNDETMKRGTLEMGDVISQFDGTTPWAQISCLYGESLMPPSTFKMFAKQTAKRKDRGLKALAVVILDSDTKKSIRSLLSQGYEDAHIDFQFFESIPEATQWIASLNIPFDIEYANQFFAQNTL